MPQRRLPSNGKTQASSARLEAIHEAERTRIRVGQTCNTSQFTTDDPPDIALTTPWMQRTQWKETYHGARRDILARMTLLPSYGSCREGQRLGHHEGVDLCTQDEDEQRLRPILLAVDLLFDRCEETYHHTARPILCWLYSQHPTVGIRRPFRLAGRVASRNRYRGLWKRFVTFLLRAHLFNPNLRRSILKVNYTTSQIRFLTRLWEQAGFTTEDDRNVGEQERVDQENEGKIVNQEGEEEAGDREDDEEEYEQDNDSGDDEEDKEEDGDNSDYDKDYSDEEEEDEEYDRDADEVEDNEESQLLSLSRGQKREAWTEDCAVKADHVRILADLVLQLSVSCIAESFLDGKPSSSLLVFFSGILSFSDNGTTYRHARDFTPYLSGLIHQQRLLFLEWALPYRPHPFLGWRSRPSEGHLKRLHQIRRKYTCIGCLTPIDEFISLRAYGRKIAPTDGPAFRVFWSEDGETVSFEGGSLRMEKFRGLGHHLLD
jgi:hypothetical protein